MFPLLLILAKLDAVGVPLSIGAGILALPLFYLLHSTLNYCYLVHARRFCRRQGFEISRWRCGPAFDQSGLKTEFTLVELDCLDGQKQRRFVRLLVWVFGIRKMLSDDKYEESVARA